MGQGQWQASTGCCIMLKVGVWLTSQETGYLLGGMPAASQGKYTSFENPHPIASYNVPHLQLLHSNSLRNSPW
jgi:hypothetical protein